MSRNTAESVASSKNLIDSLSPLLSPPVNRQIAGSATDDDGLDLAFIMGMVVGVFAGEDDE